MRVAENTALRYGIQCKILHQHKSKSRSLPTEKHRTGRTEYLLVHDDFFTPFRPSKASTCEECIRSNRCSCGLHYISQKDIRVACRTSRYAQEQVRHLGHDLSVARTSRSLAITRSIVSGAYSSIDYIYNGQRLHRMSA